MSWIQFTLFSASLKAPGIAAPTYVAEIQPECVMEEFAASWPIARAAQTVIVPEPSTITLMGMGLAAVFAYRKFGGRSR